MNMSEKMIDWLLDIAKYILSAIVITSFLSGLKERWMIYVFGIVAAGICFILAFLINKKIKDKKKK
jgi:hypothetical protein